MMKRTLAITTAALALSLAGCSADLGAGGMDAYRTRSAETVPATDSVYNGNAFGSNSSLTGTGGVAGAMNRAAGGNSAGSAYTATNNGGLTGTMNRAAGGNSADTVYNGNAFGSNSSLTGSVAGAMNRAAGGNSADGAYTAANNGGVTGAMSRTAESRYRLMLENGRVHDTDGFLLDGENAHYRTY